MPDVRFMLWMMELDRVLKYVYGVTSEDLPDMDYQAWYNDGLTPAEAAEAIQEELDAQ